MTFRNDNDALRAKLEEAETKIRHYEQDVASGEMRKKLAQEQTLRMRADASLQAAIDQRDRAFASVDDERRRGRRMGLWGMCVTGVLTAAFTTVGVAIQTHAPPECPPACPEAPVTELGAQCTNVCATLGMRQVAHFRHESLDSYACTCATEGRLCTFRSSYDAPGYAHDGSLECTDAR